VVDVPIDDTIAAKNGVNVGGDLVRTARGLGICLGDTPNDSKQTTRKAAE
jgi:hypothetical protein